MYLHKLVNKVATTLGSLLKGRSLFFYLLEGSSFMDKLKSMLAGSASVLLIYVDVADFHRIMQLNGEATAKRVLHILRRVLEKRTGQFINCCGEVMVENLWGDDFLVLCRQEEMPPPAILSKTLTALRIALEQSIKNEVIKITGHTLKLHVGYSIIRRGLKNPEQALYSALKEAQKAAKGTWEQQMVHLLGEFHDLLQNKNLRIVYQPLFLCKPANPGWEALTRGRKQLLFFTGGDF
ncbi:Diguanylate phosphodiesterase (fragment) [Desulforamulus hydrothermalis]|uniref:Diguanylate phosphodiesterase n=1 Tax=Desulforamulus hydrothermalis Lam5 = DSM 18033 TaxID=1121428 RepID=K8E945_9FIRM